MKIRVFVVEDGVSRHYEVHFAGSGTGPEQARLGANSYPTVVGRHAYAKRFARRGRFGVIRYFPQMRRETYAITGID